MVRKRVPLQLISKDTSRRRTYRSRKNNLMKKAHEFRTLCGVSTCVIIYDPENPAKNPETYPEKRDEVVAVIEKYSSTGGNRKMLGLPKFFEDRKRKVENELKKAREDNLKAKYPLPRDLIENLSRDQLRSLCHELSGKIVRAKNRLGGINGILTMTSDNNNLGVGSNMESPVTWPPLGLGFDSQLNQLDSEVAWGASNNANSYMKNSMVDLPSTLNCYDISPIQCQYPGQDQFNVSNLGNPNGIGTDYTSSGTFCPNSVRTDYTSSGTFFPNSVGTDYTSSGTFCSPAFLQYKSNPNLFMQQQQLPQPGMQQYMGPAGFSDLPPWQGVEKPGSSSHNLDQYNGGFGNADVAFSGLPLLPAAAKMEWQKEQLSSSADNQYYYRG